MIAAHWRPGPNGTGRDFLCAELHGHRLSVRRVRAGYWRACIDSIVLGCWVGRERAMAAAEEAALDASPTAPVP